MNTSEFKQDEHETLVLFRKMPGKQFADDGVIAVFPCEPGTNECDMTCYAHVGQHSSCDRGWYNRTRPATPAEYESLKRELESPPYGYRLKVLKRMPLDAIEQRRKVMQRIAP